MVALQKLKCDSIEELREIVAEQWDGCGIAYVCRIGDDEWVSIGTDDEIFEDVEINFDEVYCIWDNIYKLSEQPFDDQTFGMWMTNMTYYYAESPYYPHDFCHRYESVRNDLIDANDNRYFIDTSMYFVYNGEILAERNV